MPLTILVGSPAETESVGRALGAALGPGAVVLLSGDLGAGKTVLTRGIAAGIGVDDPSRVVSPTFAIVNLYDGPVPLAHVDLYRLPDDAAVTGAGIEEYLPWRGITIVEWGERLADPPAEAVRVLISQGPGEDGRRIDIDGAPEGLVPLPLGESEGGKELR